LDFREASFGSRFAACDWLQIPAGPWKDHGTFQPNYVANGEIEGMPSRMSSLLLEAMELFSPGTLENLGRYLEMISSQNCLNSRAVSAFWHKLATSSPINIPKEGKWC
jgi:hypothetical protein